MEMDPVYSMALCQGPVQPGSPTDDPDTKKRNELEQDEENKSEDYGNLW